MFRGIKRVLKSFDAHRFDEIGLIEALKTCEQFPGSRGFYAVTIGILADLGSAPINMP